MANNKIWFTLWNWINLYYPECIWMGWKQLEFSAYGVRTEIVQHTLIPVTYVYMTLLSVSYTVLLLNYIFEKQNINGGIFAPSGKNVFLLLEWTHLFCHTNEHTISD